MAIGSSTRSHSSRPTTVSRCLARGEVLPPDAGTMAGERATVCPMVIPSRQLSSLQQ